MRSTITKAVCAATLWSMAAAGSVRAGDISIAWDPVPGAAGYHVYYGVQSGTYGAYRTYATNAATLTGLQDCQTYYIAVKAYNTTGESADYSNEIAGWARPVVTSTTPTTAIQGDQVTVDIMGTNFQSAAAVSLNPNRGTCSMLRTKQCSTDADCVSATEGTCVNSVVLTSVSVLSCSHLQLLVAVEPTAGGIRPAQVGKADVTVVNPDRVFGTKPQAFEVLINSKRFDVNQSDPATTNRIDGKDAIYLSRYFALRETDPNYEPDDDFNGDGWVDGVDLAYIASNLGRCWSAATNAWTASACPANLQ